MKLLFVCSGNICRSPMAAAYCRSRAAKTGLSRLIVTSAGTLGIEGAPASAPAIEVMKEIGVDLSGHRSQGVDATGLRTADMVVAMDHSHLEWLASRHPGGRDRRMLLRAFESASRPEPSARDLEDPIGKSVEFYREQRELLVRCIDHLLLHLKHQP